MWAACVRTIQRNPFAYSDPERLFQALLKELPGVAPDVDRDDNDELTELYKAPGMKQSLKDVSSVFNKGLFCLVLGWHARTLYRKVFQGCTLSVLSSTPLTCCLHRAPCWAAKWVISFTGLPLS